MKPFYTIAAVSALSVYSTVAQEVTPRRVVVTRDVVKVKLKGAKDHSEYATDPDLWNTKMADFKEKNETLKCKWQTNQKRDLRSTARIPLFGQKSGETIIKGKNGKIGRIEFSVFNRGDHGALSASSIRSRFNVLKKKIDEATNKKHRDVTKKGALKITSYMWKTDKSAYLLEMSSTGNIGEFLRLRMAPRRDANSGNKNVSRSTLKRNVKREPNGDIWIDNIPMVDQGAKGYCACASSARIFQYYGREVSMHEIAQMAGSDSGGTSPVMMISAFRKAATKLDSRVLVLYEYPKYLTEPMSMKSMSKMMSKMKKADREVISDVNKYQSLAKKKKTGALTIAGKVGGRIPSGLVPNIWGLHSEMDPEIYKEVMMKKSSFKRYMSNVKKYINEGVPVGWGLQLGMFKEDGLPQTGGGHMRLIIGYNEKKGTIIYSDSWGAGHSKKSMPAGNAFCMTQMLLTLPPTN